MKYNRLLNLGEKKSSIFLFGPRMTGKTTLIRGLCYSLFINLLDPEVELKYRRNPNLLKEQLFLLPDNSSVIIDEIQKIPELLNVIQMAIEEKNLRFILSGSSARKLKRGGANLLGGRAHSANLHPLTKAELGIDFNLQHALEVGTLPRVALLIQESQFDEINDYLRGYATIYIKEEIQAEALTRNLGAFQRFLSVASQANGQILEYVNISRECSVPASSVKEYYQILEDTLIGNLLWCHDHSERKKTRPKFYFFDCGVVQSLNGRLSLPPTEAETGILFETWFINEVRRISDYAKKDFSLSYWRERHHEIDLLISKGGKVVLAVELKSGKSDMKKETAQLFKMRFPDVPIVVASKLETIGRKTDLSEILPWEKVIDKITLL